jgi:phosphoribosylamine-glycine ligase
VARAYEAVGKISFEGMQYRKDIGQKALARLHEPR